MVWLEDTIYNDNYSEFCLDVTWNNSFVFVLHILINQVFYFFDIGQLFHLLRILIQQLLVVDLLRFNQMIFFLDIEARFVVAHLTHGIDYVISVFILIAFLKRCDSSSANSTRLQLFDLIFTWRRSSITFGDHSLSKRMLVNNELITVIAKHEILTFLTFPHAFSFLKTFAAVIAKEPVMAFLILLFFRYKLL